MKIDVKKLKEQMRYIRDELIVLTELVNSSSHYEVQVQEAYRRLSDLMSKLQRWYDQLNGSQVPDELGEDIAVESE